MQQDLRKPEDSSNIEARVFDIFTSVDCLLIVSIRMLFTQWQANDSHTQALTVTQGTLTQEQ